MGANGIETMPLVVTGQGDYTLAPEVDDAAPRCPAPEHALSRVALEARARRALCELLQALHGGRRAAHV